MIAPKGLRALRSGWHWSQAHRCHIRISVSSHWTWTKGWADHETWLVELQPAGADLPADGTDALLWWLWPRSIMESARMRALLFSPVTEAMELTFPIHGGSREEVERIKDEHDCACA